MMPKAVSQWTAPRDQQLETLWIAGHSTAEIGRRMNTTKNAVVGRAHRLKLTPRPAAVMNTNAPSGKKRRRPERVYGPPPPPPPLPAGRVTLPKLVSVPVAPPPAPKPAPVPVRSTRFKSCQFIRSNQRPWLFCEAPAVEILTEAGKTIDAWCAKCFDVVYQRRAA